MFEYPSIDLIVTALSGKLFTLLVLMFMDLLFGVIVALVKKEFKWDYLTNYLVTGFLPIAAWLAIGLLGFIPDQYIPASVTMVAEVTVYATVFLKLLASFLASMSALGVLTAPLGKIGVGE
jgi:hypothetical protein